MSCSNLRMFRPFSGRRARAIATALAVLMIVVVPAEYHSAAADLQLSRAKATAAKPPGVTRAFSLSGTGSQKIDFEVRSAGQIEARAEWTGSAGQLALILNGPGKVSYYARKDGPSPLTLTFDVTTELLTLGPAWRISVSNFAAQTQAQGTVRLTYPGGVQSAQTPTAAATPPTGTKPSAQASAAKTDKAREATAEQVRGTAAVRQKTTRTPVAKVEGQAPLRPQRPQLSADTVRSLAEYEIAEAIRKEPAAAILIPLAIKGIEESWAGTGGRTGTSRSALTAASSRQAAAFQKSRLSAGAASRVQNSVNILRSLSAGFRQRNFHPRYADLRPGQPVNRQQLAADVFEILRPDYRAEIRSAVRTGLASLERTRTRVLTRADRPSARTVRQKTVAGAARKLSDPRRARLQNTANSLQSSRTDAQRKDLQNALTAQAREMGFTVNEALTRDPVAAAAIEGLTPARTGDLNAYHQVLDYYRYQVLLDRLHCVNDNEWEDEPYLVIRTITPQFEPADPRFLQKVVDGCLDGVQTWMTPAFSGVDSGEDRAFERDDRWVLDSLTYGSPTTISFDLWEWDNTRGEVMDAVEQLAISVAVAIRDEIVEAVTEEVLKIVFQLIAEGLAEQLGLGSGSLEGLFAEFFGKDVDPDELWNKLTGLMQGQPGTGLITTILFLILTKGNLMGLLETVGLGSAVLGVIFMLPLIYDIGEILIQGLGAGDFLETLKNLLLYPFESLVGTFTEIWNKIKEIVHIVLAILDPDDFIASQSVTILHAYAENAFQDAVIAGTTEAAWWGANVETISRSEASRQNREGYGPSEATHNLITSRGDFVVPKVRLKAPDAVLYEGTKFERRFSGTDYVLYYNVKRTVAAGRETFGFSLKGDGADGSGFVALENYQPYVAKGARPRDPGYDNRIRVYIASDTEEPPFVYIRQGSRSWFNLGGERYFEMESYPGQRYDISVYKFGKGDMSGQILIVDTPQVNDTDIVCVPPARPQAGQPPKGRTVNIR